MRKFIRLFLTIKLDKEKKNDKEETSYSMLLTRLFKDNNILQFILTANRFDYPYKTHFYLINLYIFKFICT